MRGFPRILRGIRRDEKGFSLAEVVVGIALFVAVVLGMSSLLISGGSLIGSSAKANSAMRLASAQIEQVKSLPFYVEWGGANADVDDTYWRWSNANGTGTRLTNAQQVTQAWRTGEAGYEAYGSISGFPNYERKTTIQYMCLVGTEPNTQLKPAVMMDTVNVDYWVPKNPDILLKKGDRPKGRRPTVASADLPVPTPDPTATPEYLHLMTIEVKVSYVDNGIKRTYTERGLSSDLLTSGGSMNKVMVVESLQAVREDRRPAWGYKQFWPDLAIQCDVFIDAAEMTKNDVVKISLWQTGQNDIAATNVVWASGRDSDRRCTFNLGAMWFYPTGDYNLSVEWVSRQFKDSNLRNCFELRSRTPSIESVESVAGNETDLPAWGYELQTARKLLLSGSSLCDPADPEEAPPIVTLTGKDGTKSYTMVGTVNEMSDDATTLTVTFNPSAIKPTGGWSANMLWDVHVDRNSGSVGTKASCFTMNPTAVVTRVEGSGIDDVNGTPVPYYDWAYHDQSGVNVKISGEYLYDLGAYVDKPHNDGIHLNSTMTTGGDWCASKRLVAVYENDINNLRQYDNWAIVEFGPSCKLSNGNAGHSDWPTQTARDGVVPTACVVVINEGGKFYSDPADDMQNVYMNAKPQVTADDIPSTAIRKAPTQTGKTVTGQFFQQSGAAGSTSMFLSTVTDPESKHAVPIVLSQNNVVSSDGTTVTMDLALSKDCFLRCDKFLNDVIFPAYLGTDPSITGDYYLFVRNADGQLSDYVPGLTCNISHGTLKVHRPGTTPSGGTNFWDVSLGTLTVDYFMSGDCTIQMWNANQTVPYDPLYQSYPTVEGTPAVSGEYGTNQTVSGLKLNLINITPGTYYICLKDTENDQFSTVSNSMQYTVDIRLPEAPVVLSPATVQDGTSTTTFYVQAKGLYYPVTGYSVWVVLPIQYRSLTPPYDPLPPWPNWYQNPWVYVTSVTTSRGSKSVYASGIPNIPIKTTISGATNLSEAPYNCSHGVYILWYGTPTLSSPTTPNAWRIVD